MCASQSRSSSSSTYLLRIIGARGARARGFYGTPGRTCTRVDPGRNRAPGLLGHGGYDTLGRIRTCDSNALRKRVPYPLGHEGVAV